MRSDSRPNPSRPRVLATDLDGTLIPLADHAASRHDLKRLRALLASESIPLAFVTGRHLAIVEEAIQEHDLPLPGWIICDVGTSIYEKSSAGWTISSSYREHLAEICRPMPITELREKLAPTRGLSMQEDEKQGEFKLSFYTDVSELDDVSAELDRWLTARNAPYRRISSVDPFTNVGLIDLLPAGTSKAFAVEWWRQFHRFEMHDIVFAGDSGNDLAALTAGYHAIIVGNADRRLAEVVAAQREAEAAPTTLYLAESPSTSGVLEGCRALGLFRQLPAEARLGATPISDSRTEFSVWAPRRNRVDVQFEAGDDTLLHQLTPRGDGFFQGFVDGAGPGTRYAFRLDSSLTRPDPASRFQPDGVHGPSQVVDPRAYQWNDESWKGVPKSDLVIYELHVGTFTAAGTLRAAVDRLDALRKLGVTAVEIMPVAEVPGRWNWGYDGVGLFAVTRNYGTPEDFQAFVDAAHATGLAVILDVVYNHVGPEGNYLADFGPYFSTKHHTPWGETFNFDGSDSARVREFVIENARRWLDEYHLDGLRLDAVHCMYDDGTESIRDAIRRAVTEFAREAGREVHLIAETNVFDDDYLRERGQGGAAYDAIWCDDIMHALHSHVAPASRHVKRDYTGAPDVDESLRFGFLYSGRNETRVSADDRKRLYPNGTGRELGSFIISLQNHDIVGNDLEGRRIHQLTTRETQRAAAALVLLYPAIPLLFMGEEYAADSRFHFFTDFEDAGLRSAVETGRARDYPQQRDSSLISPLEDRAFTDSKLSDSGDEGMRSWYTSLIALRKAWRAAGILDPNRLVVECVPQSGVFSLRYPQQRGSDHFVISRLRADSCETSDLQIPCTGELWLDSQRPEQFRQPIEGHITLAVDQALVGTGAWPNLAEACGG